MRVCEGLRRAAWSVPVKMHETISMARVRRIGIRGELLAITRNNPGTIRHHVSMRRIQSHERCGRAWRQVQWVRKTDGHWLARNGIRRLEGDNERGQHPRGRNLI